ncbi:hypothetical protein [Arthrobacter castelli]|uniref:hypothetical protein n=1 Tax=Arthrobacter castelli TaxID=271431 RepID=UPI0004187719|nr:hypothetical protein [Arthrobacter castelli]
MDTYEKHDRFVKNDSTIQRLMADRLIEISSETMLPKPYRNQHGVTVKLTDRGRFACR